MKNVILFLFINLFIGFNIHAQEQEKLFKLGIETNIGISDRMFIDNGGPIRSSFWSDIEKITVAREFGFLIEIKLSEKIGLQSGIKFIQWGAQSGKIGFITIDQLSVITGPIDENELQANGLESEFVVFEHRHQYLEIPLRFNYYINPIKNGLYLFLETSPSYNFVNNTVQKLYQGDNRTSRKKVKDTISPFRKLNINAALGFGWQKSISKRLAFFLQPNFKTQVLPQAKDVLLNRRLFSYGIGMGIKFI